MTLTRFVTKNALRNKRRSILTIASIGVSLLLLTFMMTLWQGFYIDKGSAESTRRLVTRHRVSLTFSLPSFYREKIRAIPGVVAVVPNSWLKRLNEDFHKTIVMGTHDPHAASYAHVTRHLEKGMLLPPG